MVEHSAVNRVVAGSSPARGARALSESESKTMLEVSAKPAEPLARASVSEARG